MVGGDVVVAERELPVAVEEVPLLAVLLRVVALRVLHQPHEPPGRPAALEADSHEVGRAGDLTGEALHLAWTRRGALPLCDLRGGLPDPRAAGPYETPVHLNHGGRG
ncbi:MAG: hypothetical protein M5T61_05585 [Acidimicrobiia bacterium]|nr:hypothetical protein [Acidimicrobiia bacterium]